MKTLFTIDRSKWRCGGAGANQHGEGETLLLNEHGFMCCLGQIAEQIGLDRECLFNCPDPEGLDFDDQKAIDGFLITHEEAGAAAHHTDFASAAIDVNDNGDMEDDERERELYRIAEACGIRLEFTGEYPRGECVE